MNTENTLCLIIDIQERLLPALHGSEQMIEHCRILLQGLSALNIPFAATEQYPKGLGKTVSAISLLLHNTPIFEKTRFSAASPEVMAILKEKQIENIILIGAEAHICMLQTTLDLLKHNIRVHIPYECTTSRNPLNKDNALQQMLTAGAAVSNVESLLFNLMGDAKHPAFKTISKLIQ